MLTNTPYTLAVDTLSVMVSQPHGTPYPFNISALAGVECIASGASRLVLIHNTGRSFYRFAYEIQINGKAYGTLHLQSLRKESPLMKITIFNQCLYTDFITPFNQFQRDFALRVNNISKLDIAIDTNTNLILWFLNYFEQPDQYEYMVNHRQRDSIRSFATEYRNGTINKSLYPYRVEDKSFRLYNKSQEIRDNGNHKAYIQDYQQANGLNINADVYRAEISLGNSVMKTHDTVYQEKNTLKVISEHKYNKLPEAEQRYYQRLTETREAIDFFQLMDANYLADVFNRYAGKLVEFRQLDNIRPTRRSRVPFFELSNPRPLVPLVSLALPGKYQQRNHLHTLKQLVQQSYSLALPALLTSAYDLAAATGLTERVAGFEEVYKPRQSFAPLNTVPVKTSTLPL